MAPINPSISYNLGLLNSLILNILFKIHLRLGNKEQEWVVVSEQWEFSYDFSEFISPVSVYSLLIQSVFHHFGWDRIWMPIPDGLCRIHCGNPILNAAIFLKKKMWKEVQGNHYGPCKDQHLKPNAKVHRFPLLPTPPSWIKVRYNNETFISAFTFTKGKLVNILQSISKMMEMEVGRRQVL